MPAGLAAERGRQPLGVSVTNDGPSFPIGETFANGLYRLDAPLFGYSADRVDLASSRDEPGVRFLVSSTDRRVDLDTLKPAPGDSIPGVFDLVFVGTLDEAGSGLRERSMRSGRTVVVERLPPGSSARRLITGALPADTAMGMGIAVGKVLNRVAQSGRLMLGIRPETIWAERTDASLTITGVSTRSEALFRAAKGACYVSVPPFERRYTAPEIVRGEPTSDRTLSFLLSLLIVEWLNGHHPFPSALTFGDAGAIAQGEHEPICAPRELKAPLAAGLSVSPRARPSLAGLLAELEHLARTMVP
jgi:hypothetical protein